MARNKDFGAAMALATDKRSGKTVTERAIDRLSGKQAEPRQEAAAPDPEGPAAAEAAAAPASAEKRTRNKPTKKGGRIAFRISEDLQRDFETLAHASEKTTTAYLTDLIEKEVRENAAVISGFRRIQDAREAMAGVTAK